MSITLAEAKVGMADKVDQAVVDEFRRDSFLLDKLVFDNAVAPGTGGSTLTYGYMQLKTPSTAARRDLNTEYTANEAKKVKKSADLDIFGGSFQVDRVLQNTSGTANEVTFQLQQKVKAASNLFHYLVINGATAGTGSAKAKFDGLAKLTAGTSTAKSAEVIDLSTAALIDTNMFSFSLMVNKWLNTMSEIPDMLLMNGDMLAVMQYIGMKMGYKTQAEDAFGRPVIAYRGIPMMDAGKFYDGTNEVDCAGIDPTKGTSSIYGVKIGLNAFHGISPLDNSAFINTYLPDMQAPGAVKTGEAEMVAGVVLKDTTKAGVLSDIKIAPAA